MFAILSVGKFIERPIWVTFGICANEAKHEKQLRPAGA